MKRGILQGIGLLRWLALVMLVVTILATRHSLSRSWLAYGLAAAALLVTVMATWRLQINPLGLLALPGLVLELLVGTCISLADGWSYEPGHAFSSAQSLGGAWPLAGVLTAGVAWGPIGGGVAGIIIGAARAGSDFANGVSISHVSASQVTSMLTTTALYAIAGAVVGRVAILLDRSERTISAARARDEVARTLHDGVLQTLAIVERSTTDPALARLAREQERSLRDFLLALPEAVEPGATPETARGQASSVAFALRRAAARFETTFAGKVSVIVASDVPVLKGTVVAALTGAAGEALTNAGKHGDARHVTVYLEPDTDKRVFCSIKDDGTGFDPRNTAEGFGISNSIRARITEMGGKVEIDSIVGQGSEVRIWVNRDGHD
jgi:signal transduction histidine kinase